MEFDECIYRLHEIARSENEEIASRLHQLAFDVSKNGISGLVPIEESGITDGVPFKTILTALQSSMEQTASSFERIRIESLYNDLISEGIDGYRQ